MSDLFHLPPDFIGDVQYYAGPIAIASNSTHQASWKKPRKGYTMAYILCIGGGGGGGGGFSDTAGNPRGGGGGGASGGYTRGLFPLALLPEALTINVGSGGAGGAAGAAGTDGNVSVVCDATVNSLIVDNTIIRSSNGQPQGGNGGTATNGGAGGAAGAVAGVSHAGHCALGIFNSGIASVIGQAGVAGGAHTGANGTNITIPATGIVLQGGAGGAGTTSADFAGGSCSAISDSWLSEQRSAAPAAGSVNGAGGFTIWKPFFSFGGQGGSSSDSNIGGAGGEGSYGAGGGGGGGGTTGGKGGTGGPGLIVIICW